MIFFFKFERQFLVWIGEKCRTGDRDIDQETNTVRGYNNRGNTVGMERGGMATHSGSRICKS